MWWYRAGASPTPTIHGLHDRSVYGRGDACGRPGRGSIGQRGACMVGAYLSPRQGDPCGRPGSGCLISSYGTATVATTCCWRLSRLVPSLYVLTKLEMFIEALVILPK